MSSAASNTRKQWTFDFTRLNVRRTGTSCGRRGARPPSKILFGDTKTFECRRAPEEPIPARPSPLLERDAMSVRLRRGVDARNSAARRSLPPSALSGERVLRHSCRAGAVLTRECPSRAIKPRAWLDRSTCRSQLQFVPRGGQAVPRHFQQFSEAISRFIGASPAQSRNTRAANQFRSQ